MLPEYGTGQPTRLHSAQHELTVDGRELNLLINNAGNTDHGYVPASIASTLMRLGAPQGTVGASDLHNRTPLRHAYRYVS